MHPRIRRQIDLTLELFDSLDPALEPGVDVPTAVRKAIARIRGAGSRDRRFYRELIHTWFRYREWIDPLRVADPERAGQILVFLSHPTRETEPAKAALPDTLPSAPDRGFEGLCEQLQVYDPDLTFRSDDLIPTWLPDECSGDSTTLLPHTLLRPPIWLRAPEALIPDLATELAAEGFPIEEARDLPGALSTPTGLRIETSATYRTGRIEIQDIGSQAVLAQVAPEPGQHWLDACAGAGGKSLHLASLLGRKGRVSATDLRPQAIRELKKRVHRSKAHTITALPPGPDLILPEACDGVLIDAPCSGSGTWRRHPWLRHQTNPQVIARFRRKQLDILDRFCPIVRPGGRLIYVTCSLCHSENQDVVSTFLEKHPEFQVDPIPNRLDLLEISPGQFLITPERFNGDAFFLANLRRKG